MPDTENRFRPVSYTHLDVYKRQALLALAKSCEMLGNAMTTFATLSWSEIARGLVGMGAALKIFTSIINQLGKSNGGASILSSVSMLIAVQSLDKLAYAT